MQLYASSSEHEWRNYYSDVYNNANAMIHSAIARKKREYENAKRALQVQRASALHMQPMKFNVFYKHVTALIKARQMLRPYTDVNRHC